MGLPKHIEELSEQADDLLDALEKAASVGFADHVMRQVVDAGGLGNSLIISDARKRWRDYPGRGLVQREVQPAYISIIRRQCDELARALCLRSKQPRLADVGMVSDSLFSAVVCYAEAREKRSGEKRGRGKPSELTQPAASNFINALADIWIAYSGRTPRAGDGDTNTRLNFNLFAQKAFEIAGVSANPYSLPRVVKRALI